MAIPNLISLIARNGVIVAETRRYLWSNNLDEAAAPRPN
jgi:alanine or glycine:cation symporter, AGCS family